jgi:vacuolar-type H+-ATPase subunit H
MSQSAIAKIKEAEEQAEVLCRVAEERATETRIQMEHKAKAHLAEVERTAIEQKEKKLAQTEELTKALLLKKRMEAENEAKELAQDAGARMDAAVSAIVWGIVENVSM